ncbi:MAG: Ig-like domain-containing protein [Tannerella sp.]|jgi:uncharacterized protein YjdB|nr:Ig-like domain-containing protein [Tannerella sp.]
MNTIKKIGVFIAAAVLCTVTACDQVDDYVPVSGVTLDVMSYTLFVGEELQLTASILPEDASNRELIWTSSNRDVASVDENGLVRSLTVGETRIWAKSMDGSGWGAYCTLLVSKDIVLVSGVDITDQNGLPVTEISVGMGQRFPLKASILPADATDKFFTWTLSPGSDFGILNVTQSGVVEGIDVGQATVYAVARNRFAPEGSAIILDSCVVNVTPVMTIDKESLSLDLNALGGSLITATLPAGSENTELVWTTSNPAIIGILPAGVSVTVIPLAAGNAVLTVATADNSFPPLTCNVTVTTGAGPETVTLALGADLKAAVAANAGKIIQLPPGFEAAFNGVAIPAGGIWIKGDPNSKAKLTAAGINFNGRTAGEVVRFENVELIGDGFTGGGYFINQGTGIPANSCNLRELSFENCRITEYGRSIVRTQTVDQFIHLIKFNNCIVERCSGQPDQDYAVIQCTQPSLAFPDIRITNSTFNTVYAEIMRISGGTGQPSGDKVLIENVTFYNVVGTNGTAPTAVRFFIDAGNNGPVNVTVKNSIMGSVRQLSVPNLQGGIRMSTASILIGEGNHATTDWLVTTAPEASPMIVDVPGTTPYSGNAEALFTDPANGNFTIKDGSFAGNGKAGDPRWW